MKISTPVPPRLGSLANAGPLAVTNRVHLAIGLPLRNEPQLEGLLQELYRPGSTHFHKFLTPEEFTAQFGPTEKDYAAVIRFATQNELTIDGKHSNRLVLDVVGSVADVERAFQVTLHLYKHPSEPRYFYAPDSDASVPTNVPVANVWGLSDYFRPIPLSHRVDPGPSNPLNYNGSGPGGSYQGRDFRNAYAPGAPLAGSGQTAAVVEFDSYYPSDIAAYETGCGYTNVPLQNVLIDNVSGTPGYSRVGNAVAEVSLDIELIIAMAPGLSNLMVYEGSNPYDVLNKIVTDNLAKQISCSWSWNVGPGNNWGHPGTETLDSLLKQMAAQGQSFFQASGDSDAYTGSQAINSNTGPIPVDSIYVTSVGGTTLTMSGTGTSWASETVWNWGNNTGSGGGVSPNYTLPYWQTNVSMSLNGGSTQYRNLPDVALTADAVHVIYNNGASGIFGGTSCAAPLWAGFTAMVNQQSTAEGGSPVGFLNPALYSIAGGANYKACFHDITTGNNIGTNTPGLFNAVTNYDLATGLGTPNGTNLINALAPLNTPYFLTQPSSQTVANGTQVSLSATAGGQSPLYYQWLCDGTNLKSGGNISGATSNILTIASASVSNDGNYQLVVSNSYGSATSSIATLTVTYPPSFNTQPTSQTVVAGANASFTATVSGASPLYYQWRQNGTNVTNSANLTGATSNYLALTSVTLASAGNYTLVVTNSYGSVTSSVATLTVVQPATITSPPAAETVQCGSNAVFTVVATGTAPLSYQWTMDGTPVAGATSTALLLSNVHFPNHTVSVLVTNLYGTATDSAALTVQDTLPPAITLNGGTPLYVELGSTFTDPGATAYDLCAGNVPVSVSGTVNTNTVGTNSLLYTASDGNGNTNSATRTVIVHDTTPPTIEWSFTNLVLAAGSNCTTALPNLTGTNSILATDLSEPLTVTQSPTNGTVVSLGTNTVVLTVLDAYGNAAYSTNTVVVKDETPPVITLNGANPLYAELGSLFTDPGATAYDACAGNVPVSVTGTVNTSAVGTNTLLYTASDGNGNTSSLTRTVVVQDTTPPTIEWSFTNLVLAAGSNCTAALPDLTVTNYILATDLSEPLTITQSPTNGTVLPLSTNTIVLTVLDAYGNAAYSTNTVVVKDETAPLITLNGANPIYVELGTVFTDPGATAYDACAGSVPVSASGTVNTNTVGTNTVVYTASDGNGNASSATRVVVVHDTTPPTIEWSFTNLVLVAGSNCTATLPNLTGTNSILATDLSEPLTITQNPTNGTVLPLSTNTIVLTVLDAYGNAAYSTNTVVVKDQTPPVITLNGGTPVYVELGSTFVDPGASAYDACAGAVPVGVSGTVNTNSVGTNTLLYTASDGNGNTSSLARTVIVRDTTPPTIEWSFTNLVAAAGSNCTATLPDLTGTNYILATDLSEPLTITQSPTNGTPLALGINTILLAVMDTYGNTAYSTNTVLVQDQTPPVILTQPQSQTNAVGTTATFSTVGTACTPLSFQWFFNQIALASRTNSTLTLSNISSSDAGNYAVVCTASGGATTSAVATLTVALRSSTLTLGSSENPAGFEDSLKFTATVIPTNATGSIQFFTNGVAFDLEPLTAGQSLSTNLALLPRGTNLITAVYSGDAATLPCTNMLEQVVTNHPPVALAAFYARAAGLPLDIAVTNLAAGWSDPDGDPVSLSAVGVSTNGIVVTNNSGTLVYWNPNNVPDQFVCTVTDGWGGTNYQVVSISVVSSTVSTVPGTPAGTVTLDLAGASGYTYVLQATTNLLPAAWSPIATNMLGTNGLWEFTDPQAGQFPQRFYRLRTQ